LWTGAPHSTAYSVPVEGIEFAGEMTEFKRRADGGGLVTWRRCAECGTAITGQSSSNTDIVSVFAATLEDGTEFTPISNVYVSEAPSWANVDPNIISFEKMPE